MTIVSAYKCDIGRVHNQNDDYVWVDDQAGLYIVADGMGGHEAGNVASQMTADSVGPSIVSHLKTDPGPHLAEAINTLMTNAIEAANEAVFKAAKKAEQKRKMGTTIVAALLRGSTAYISHAGDSRAYLAREDGLHQLTEDDSWGAQFATVGVETKTDGGKGRFDHFLTKSVGQEARLDPSFTELTLEPDDWLVLCSDGLWNMVEDPQILAELQKAGDNPEQAVEALVEIANNNGGKDNISLVAIKILAE